MPKTVKNLRGAPGSLPLYAKAALPMLPGASRLPFVAGSAKKLPSVELRLDGVRADLDQLTAYNRVCGFPLKDTLPATYLHIRAFPLHMALMTDGNFPFPAIGLVHLRNRIEQLKPLTIDQSVDLRVSLMPLQPHPRGRTFTIVTEAYADNELVWRDASTMLRRGKPLTNGSRPNPADRAGGAEDGRVRAARRVPARPQVTGPARHPRSQDLPEQAEWQLKADLGRQYAAVSGDRNPIHLHPLTARAFGFPKAIAHGMWTKAHCLAALDTQLPDAFTVDVAFRRPILLPSRVTFAAEGGNFAVRSTNRNGKTTIQLEGSVTAA